MYRALYRKYRPTDFDSVVGQESIIKTLQNSIVNQNFSHAYMFFGPRGTGKTSVSKIFARNVNCLSPKNGLACKKCDACQFSFSNECVDIIEIDAASNNGVNEIRELRNNVALVPSELKYKVYIVDEVHMLSDAAFNALLKTLEEPPAHVIFILATTDPEKVPDTIVSRCQCFSFKRISNETIRERLAFICKKEKIKIEDAVLDKIALLSDGGLRDAIGLLDKMVSYTDEKITIDDFNEVNGIVSDQDLFELIQSIMSGDIKNTLEIISQFNIKGKNLIQIMIQVVNYTRDIIVDYYLEKKNTDLSIDLLQVFVNELNEKMNDIKRSSNTKVFIEMFLLKFINDYISSNDNIEKNPVEKDKSEIKSEKNIDSKPKLNNNDFYSETDVVNHSSEDVMDYNYHVPKIINIDEILSVRINNTFATADKKLLKEESSNFELLKDYSFDQEIGYLVNELLDSKIRVVGTDSMIISYDSDAIVAQNLVNILKLQDVYNQITKSNKNIAIVSDQQWDVLKNEYISKIKNNEKYELLKEPDILLEEIKNDDIISNSAISLFGDDIVEIE
ncbi:MAG: DNA polymerase III subunit gamma/tau [Bacilli bacterium]|nr:DNA polymerase III subunit gamma/tau [Bacilli bacterium]